MNFERGMDPMRAMKIGVITWNKIGSGMKLLAKHTVPLTHLITTPGKPIAENVHKFACDGAGTTDTIPWKRIIFIKKAKIKKSIIEITYYPDERCSRDDIEYHLTGPIERFRKYFDIVQER